MDRPRRLAMLTHGCTEQIDKSFGERGEGSRAQVHVGGTYTWQQEITEWTDTLKYTGGIELYSVSWHRMIGLGDSGSYRFR
jgi:hypothetical protein